MEILLQTNRENYVIAFRDVFRYHDGSGYSSIISVKSGGFSAERPFYFEEDSVEQFLKQLVLMDQSLTGSAVLKPVFKENYISLKMLERGHVKVEGFLIEYSPSQSLKFSFCTDQTCLKPLIKDFESLRIA